MPKAHCYNVFITRQNLSHPGLRATQRLVTSKFIWPGIRRDVLQWDRECLTCHRAKVTGHTHTSVGKFQVPYKYFNQVHNDIIEPLPPSQGYMHALTCTSRFTGESYSSSRYYDRDCSEGFLATLGGMFRNTYTSRN